MVFIFCLRGTTQPVAESGKDSDCGQCPFKRVSIFHRIFYDRVSVSLRKYLPHEIDYELRGNRCFLCLRFQVKVVLIAQIIVFSLPKHESGFTRVIASEI